LPDTLEDLQKYMRNEEREPLIQLIHKLHGATCYTGVPHIKQLTEILETQLKAGSPIEQLEPELFDLEDQLQNLLDESAKWQW
jgi:two-component system sensor histidine kinase BarA